MTSDPDLHLVDLVIARLENLLEELKEKRDDQEAKQRPKR